MERTYNCYKLHFSRHLQAKQFWTENGVRSAAARMQRKGEHGEIVGYRYEEDGLHLDKLGTF